jgi:hypothetical protein
MLIVSPHQEGSGHDQPPTIIALGRRSMRLEVAASKTATKMAIRRPVI